MRFAPHGRAQSDATMRESGGIDGWACTLPSKSLGDFDLQLIVLVQNRLLKTIR